jgi:hypothetical protein
LSFAFKGATAAQHLIQNGAKRIDVSAGVHWLAFKLLRRHVWQRPGDYTRRRHGNIAIRERSPIQYFGQPEILFASKICRTKARVVRDFEPLSRRAG